MEGSSNREDQPDPCGSQPPVSSSDSHEEPLSEPSTSRVEGEGTEYRDTLHRHQRRPLSSRISYRINFSVPNIAQSNVSDDGWSCLLILIAFWFFASMTLIFGFYGSVDLELGPDCSRLIQTNPLFVRSIKVENIDDSKNGPILYGFGKLPSLDVESTWKETHTAYIPVNFHKEWVHFLNRGSRMEILYEVKSSLPLSLVIAQGRESLIEWIEDPSFPGSTLSWNIIHGSGMVPQDISESSSYHIAVGNLNSAEVEVELNFSIKALLYNTTQANSKCFLGDLPCSLKLSLVNADAAVLTSPGFRQGTQEKGWFAKVSYDPRWITYFIGSGVLTVFILVVFKFCSMLQTSNINGNAVEFQAGVTETAERAPLLVPKNDEVSSLGSSYESISHDECDLEERFAAASLEGKPSADGEISNNPCRLCVICYDAPRDCFFLPCGHCAACFECGSRIAEEAGYCPICRRRMKKVRKIFSV